MHQGRVIARIQKHLLRDIVVFFAGDVLRFSVRRVLDGIDNQAYFDHGIGTILNSVDIGSAESHRQQVPINFKVLVDVSLVVHVAFR